MKNIPVAMRNKLLNRFKAASTDSEPHLRLVATQASMNTLMSEKIHSDVEADYGDVTVRQTTGENNLSLAYAICIHDGEASVYERKMPADLDEKWTFVFEVGECEDVAIEYDGTWEIDASFKWYILRTEQYPYIFTVEDGDLYVQKWRDTTTKTLLAEDVSEISACKGWQNGQSPELDHGLIIGYLRGGEVYYRSYCTQQDGTRAWESERKVTTLGTGNTTLSVIRTNDYRVGFLTQNGDDMMLTLTHRNYGGQSWKPEVLHCAAKAVFSYEDVVHPEGFTKERATAFTNRAYFLVDTVPASEEVGIRSTEKVNRDEGFLCYGVKIRLNKGFGGTADDYFKQAITVSYVEGSTTKTTTVTSYNLNTANDTITLYFAEDISRVCPITVVIPAYDTLWYYRVQSMKWPLPSLTATFAAETNNIYAYDPETLSTEVEADFEYEAVTKTYTFDPETLETDVTTVFTLEPAGILPI